MARGDAGDEARLLAAMLQAFEEAGADYEPVLDLVCQLGTEVTGDPWMLRLIDDDGRLYLAGSAAPDEETLADVRAVMTDDRAPFDTSFAAAILGDGGVPRLLDAETVLSVDVQLYGHVLDLILRRGFSGGVIAPLRARGRIIGTIWWSCQHHDGVHDEDDLLFASSVADRCALAVDNARLLRSLRTELEERTLAEQLHSTLLSHVSDAIVVVDGQGVVMQVTSGVERVLGWRDDVVGQNVFDFVHPDDHAHAIERFLEVLGPEELPATTIRVRHANGSWRHIEVSGDNLLGDPAVRGIVITAHDVTGRMWADEL